jgi:hypothetical protein
MARMDVGAKGKRNHLMAVRNRPRQAGKTMPIVVTGRSICEQNPAPAPNSRPRSKRNEAKTCGIDASILQRCSTANQIGSRRFLPAIERNRLVNSEVGVGQRLREYWPRISGLRKEPPWFLSEPGLSLARRRAMNRPANWRKPLQRSGLNARRPAAEVSAPGVYWIGVRIRYFA